MTLGVVLGVVLFGVWLLWSGIYKTLIVSLGLVSCILVVWLARRMDLLDKESVPLRLPLRALVYLPWLFWEIFQANVSVAWRILHPRMPIAPRMMRVKAGQRGDLGRVIYANSITLTPGTVSVGIEGDEIQVHALTREAAEGLETGEMDRRVTRFEGGR